MLAYPLPNFETHPYVVLDPIIPIRALYFPSAFQDPRHKDRSVISRVLFYLNSSLELGMGDIIPMFPSLELSGKAKTVRTSPDHGLGWVGEQGPTRSLD